MRLDPNPLFRRIIPPWYDSTLACWVLLVCSSLIVLFSVSGLSVARESIARPQDIWVPISLLVLSAFVCCSIALRLLQRYVDGRAQKRHEQDADEE
jgi:hypothetical protein